MPLTYKKSPISPTIISHLTSEDYMGEMNLPHPYLVTHAVTHAGRFRRFLSSRSETL